MQCSTTAKVPHARRSGTRPSPGFDSDKDY
jgi:hypothetical protein